MALSAAASSRSLKPCQLAAANHGWGGGHLGREALEPGQALVAADHASGEIDDRLEHGRDAPATAGLLQQLRPPGVRHLTHSLVFSAPPRPS
jgi:hypothetical protein